MVDPGGRSVTEKHPEAADWLGWSMQAPKTYDCMLWVIWISDAVGVIIPLAIHPLLQISPSY